MTDSKDLLYRENKKTYDQAVEDVKINAKKIQDLQKYLIKSDARLDSLLGDVELLKAWLQPQVIKEKEKKDYKIWEMLTAILIALIAGGASIITGLVTGLLKWKS